MKKHILLVFVLFLGGNTFGQSLTVEKIMRDPKWMGVSPSNPFWAEDASKLYFSWNPDLAKGDSLYVYDLASKQTRKVLPTERKALPARSGTYNRSQSQKLYEKNGDIFWLNIASGQIRQLTQTTDYESDPRWNAAESHVIFRRGNNLFKQALASGELTQLTNFQPGSKKPEAKPSEQEQWLKADQLALFEVLRQRADAQKTASAIQKNEQPKRPREFFLDDKTLETLSPSPSERYVAWRVGKNSTAKTTVVPSYVTESGYTENLPARTKVGSVLPTSQFFVYDTEKDTLRELSLKSLFDPKLRKATIFGPQWAKNSASAVLQIRSTDNKDRWIVRLNPETMQLTVLDHLHDDAWVGGPGGFWLNWLDNERIIFMSEASGFSHLYTVNINSGVKQQLTSGKFEVQRAELSRDKKTVYFQSNEVHPGEQHWYTMPVSGGETTRLTTATGANDAVISPDEKYLLVRHSTATRPWELFLQENRPNTTAIKLTESLSQEFKNYPWRDPQVIVLPTADGKGVYARLYTPKKKNGAAVIFVHGAGYLQNAHKWWSTYFREYFFHNLLADKGYTVIDIDYRASAGYGRDVRTAIYGFMGGKDLDDQVDGAKYLVEKQGINPKRIGIYGGSYGGFITLMAMFTKPGTFAAGAALRPVTDWAAYNHGYTSNILNEPQTDSLAYRRSSPIYHAAGLQGKLLICHGIVDINVHFQDAVRLAQRLIELKKENWELAVYPLEDHGFVEPTSWMDEYKRILKLFEGM